jgi:L-ascorbate metabolism protein UlaG (beta-lactamase superfamily)
MKKPIKILKKMGLYIFVVVLLLVVLVVLFVNLSPEFGGSPTKEQKERYNQSANFKDGVFENIGGVKMDTDFKKILKMTRLFFNPNPDATPQKNITVTQVDSLEIDNYNGKTRLIWFGHSAFLLQMEGKNILIDPMFGNVPAPNPMLGQKRFSARLPIAVEKLPKIDAVLFSHDHYDHLDYGSVKLLKEKVDMFYTPLGVGPHLIEWGVAEDQVVELDWWQDATLFGLRFICTPAQHFSGRGLTDRGKSLWGSWVIQSAKENIFFSGDSGYGAHFKEIGEKFGPFDFAMLECGQYNQLWKEIHMMPEETAQAGIDIKAKKIMPIHWGAFKLAMHPWTEPVERVSKKALELGIATTAPKIGAFIYIDSTQVSNEPWWKEF